MTPRRWTSVALLFVAGCSCGGGDRAVLVDLYTDYRPGVELTAVRVEMSDTPFSTVGRVITAPIHAASREQSYVEGVRVAELDVEHCERVYVRVTLLDAANRRRGERLVEVPAECATRALRVDVSLACAGVVCDVGTVCRAGRCVPPTCGGDAGPCGECAAPEDCPAPALACQSATCTEAGCLSRDDCPDDAYCAAGGCTPIPVCGDGACDPSTETPCGCPADCTAEACPATCEDGACGPDESSASCPEDCGPPAFVCGDGICEVLETCDPDCGGAGVCGDGACDPGESCERCDDCCPSGCGDIDCGMGCGDGTCDATETDCALDCGASVECGDDRCDAGEDCPVDCPAGVAVCGDGECEADLDESCGSCQADCGWCVGQPAVHGDASCRGEATGGDGPVCGDLAGAYTSAAVNLAHYPMFVAVAETDLLTGEGRVIRALPNLTRFAVQSTRNPSCLDRPPLRPPLHGYAFGYVTSGTGLEDRVGWVRIADLVLDGLSASEPCANGPQGESFQVDANAYSRDPVCQPIECAGPLRSCRDANPVGEGADECGGTLVDRTAFVDADTLWLRYAAAGPARRILHRDDELRVLYQTASWLFVELRSSATPMLNPAGSRGWVEASSVR